MGLGCDSLLNRGRASCLNLLSCILRVALVEQLRKRLYENRDYHASANADEFGVRKRQGGGLIVDVFFVVSQLYCRFSRVQLQSCIFRLMR